MLRVRTFLAESKIHGIGVFVADRVPSGTTLWEFDEGFDLALSEEQISRLPALLQQPLRNYCYRSYASGLWILCADDARFFNHASSPSTKEVEDAASEEGITVARFDLDPGSELTCDYRVMDADWRRKLE